MGIQTVVVTLFVPNTCPFTSKRSTQDADRPDPCLHPGIFIPHHTLWGSLLMLAVEKTLTPEQWGGPKGDNTTAV